MATVAPRPAVRYEVRAAVEQVVPTVATLRAKFLHSPAVFILAVLARFELVLAMRTENDIATGMRALVAFKFVPTIFIIPITKSLAVFRAYADVTLSRGAGAVSYTHLTLPTIYSV